MSECVRCASCCASPRGLSISFWLLVHASIRLIRFIPSHRFDSSSIPSMPIFFMICHAFRFAKKRNVNEPRNVNVDEGLFRQNVALTCIIVNFPGFRPSGAVLLTSLCIRPFSTLDSYFNLLASTPKKSPIIPLFQPHVWSRDNPPLF